jgi:hypothetical protein
MAVTGCEEQGPAVAVNTNVVPTVALAAGLLTVTSAKAGAVQSAARIEAEIRNFMIKSILQSVGGHTSTCVDSARQNEWVNLTEQDAPEGAYKADLNTTAMSEVVTLDLLSIRGNSKVR